METTRSSFVPKVAIALSTVLLAAVMLVCIPQGQALADDTASDSQSNMRLATFGDTGSANLQATEEATENAPQQASGIKAKYGLLAKNGTLYPCNSKGKKLGKAFKSGSTVKTIFVAANATKLPALTKTKYWVYPSYGSVSAKVTKIKFLGKKSKVTTIAKSAYKNHSSLKKVINLNKTKVKTIPNSAFESTSLTSISLPKTVTKIGELAFAGTKIKKITLPKALKTIGKNAFRSTSKLKTVTGLEKTKVTSIPAYAFAQSGITSISLPAGLKSIGENAFRQDKALKTVKGLGSTKVTTIGNYAFEEAGITSLALPSTLESIGREAFAIMPALTSVSGLDKTQLKALSEYAFAKSPKVTSISLPVTCTEIGYMAFYDCTALTSVKVPCSVVATGSTDMFEGTQIALGNGTITVPAKLVSSYKTASFWRYYASCIVS